MVTRFMALVRVPARIVWLGVMLACTPEIAAKAALSSTVSPAQAPPSESRFARTALYLQQSDAEMRADFVTTALALLADAYAEEASLARQAALTATDGEKLLGWARAVEHFARQLPWLVDDVEQGFPVGLIPGSDGSFSVSVAGRRLMLIHPRADQQAVFEQSILTAFCRRHDCAAFTPGQAALEPIPVSAANVHPQWTFTESGAVCSHRGLEVDFGSGPDIARKRATCEQLLREAVVLSQEIGWQRRHAVRIDWEALSLSPLPGRMDYALSLNAAGDTLLASVPLIHASPGLLQAITPWLRSEVMQTEGFRLRLRASDFDWIPASQHGAARPR